MDGVGSSLAHAVRQQMSPVVMICATAKAEESCQRNGVSFVDLFRPFCSLGNINVPVRTASEQPYRLTEFFLRMFYASEIAQPGGETAEEFLVQVVNENNESVSGGGLEGNFERADLASMVTEADSRAPSFQNYSREFMRTLAFSDHEAVDHPVACILVVSSSDVNPVNKFVDLYSSDQLPALLNEGAMDPKLLKLYVMLHDNLDGPVDRANELLLEMRSVFGVNNTRILCINSALPDSGEASSTDDIWESHLLRPMMKDKNGAETSESGDIIETKRLGSCINNVDMEEMTDFVLDLSVKHVIPCMEEKVRGLYQQVSATRKGLKNQIKNLWWRKGKDDLPGISNVPLYRYSSMESQIRVLADYAFMLRDYELALSTYRLLSSDYKNDKAWKRYAGAQEMIGLSLFMLDQSSRESELCMETAISYYQKGGPTSAPYATRSSLWFAEMHKAKTQNREAAIVLFRASAEEASSRAGLLLEQSAYCYLHTAPPMLRKYGFHLVLAGNQYANCFQRKLATYVYRSALSVFGSREWNYIHDHVYFHLGRLSTLLGNHASAVQFFKRVLTCSHQSPSNQAKFLSEFLFVIQSTAMQVNKLELDLPTIDVEHVHVHFEDHRTYGSSAAASVSESTWSSIEEGLVPAADKITALTWLDAKTTSTKKAADFNISVAGEEIGVDVEFGNPLQITLDVSDVSLVLDFSTETSREDENMDSATGGNLDSGSLPVGNLEGNPTLKVGKLESDLTVNMEEFSLKPGEKSVVRLKVTPRQPGMLKIVGVRWRLSGIAMGQRDFAILEPKKRKSRNNTGDEASPHQRLKFVILGHMPRLEASLHEMPGRVNLGEVRRLVLELSNPSTATLKKLKLKTSNPLFLLVGESGDLDQEFPGCLEVQGEQAALSGLQDAVNIEKECSKNGFIFSFPESTALEGGSTLLWPLWLHAREEGTMSLNTAIYYEPDRAISGLPYRTVRISHTLQVLPSLKIGVQITPSPLQLQQFVLRVDIANTHSSESFWLRQVSCAGNQWSLAPLPPPIVESHVEKEGPESVDVRAAFLSASVCPSQLLPASQNLSLFFRLLNLDSGNLPSHIKLGPPSSTEPLIDISTGPLPRFLLREKVHQPKPALPSFLQQQVQTTAKNGARHTGPETRSAEDVSQEGRSVNLLIISEHQDDTPTQKGASSLHDSVRVLVHDICNCSVQSLVPVVWVMEGPKCILGHDFQEEPFFNISLVLTVRNCSIFDVAVKLETFDMKPITGVGLTPMQDRRVGWFSLNPAPASGATGSGDLSGSESGSGTVLAAAAAATANYEEETLGGISSCGPYMWCNLRSTCIPTLKAGASAEIPLSVVCFAPGIYDLSRYQISWSFQAGEATDMTAEVVSSRKSVARRKQTKNTVPTYASGFGPVSGKVARLSSSLGSGSEDNCRMTGSGQGHPLLVTVLQA